MNCAVLTFHRTTNYGAVFQTYALQKVMTELGAQCEVLDYYSPIIESRYSGHSIKQLIRPSFIYNTLFRNSYIRDNRNNFEVFSNRYIKKSDVVYTPDNISSSNEIYDFFVVGSDQVWNVNCMGWDKNFLLTFADEGKRNAYAASFGYDKITNEQKAWYLSDLSKFNKVSTRESSGCKLYQEITGEKCVRVLDPTLLLQKEWLELSNTIGYTPSQRPYLLMYLMKETPSVFKKAKEIAKKMDLDIIYVNDRLLPRKGVVNKFYVTPLQWLSFFANASYIVTNSFHGTAFSVNFNKAFSVELLPPPSLVNSRIIDFLKLCGLENRILNKEANMDIKVNYSYANKVLNEERTKSKTYLKNIIKCQKLH